MKNIIYKISLYLFLILLALMIFPAGAVFADEDNHKPITQELINLVDKNPEIRKMLESSITKAKEINPDLKTNPVQSLPDYYNYLDRASDFLALKLLMGVPHPDEPETIQDICYFYFLIDQPIPELEDKGLYKNAIQYYPPFSSWLRKYISELGEYLNTEESWNDEIYQRFYADPRFGLQNDWYESPANWKTFNQFFARNLKSPDVRPIASPDDPRVVVSPVDGDPQGLWAIDKNSNILADGGLKVKNATYYSIKDLLGKDSMYKDAFANGVLTHVLLNVYDYHRYHFPVGGTVKEKKIIPGNVALEVTWDPEQKKYFFVDSLGWQFSQTRGYVIVDTEKYGIVALIPVGMGRVSSVNFEEDVQVGKFYKKGDKLGFFMFGGSDFIMLFQEKAEFNITAPKEKTGYKHILMGEEYGIMEGQPKKPIEDYWWIGLVVVLIGAGIIYQLRK